MQIKTFDLTRTLALIAAFGLCFGPAGFGQDSGGSAGGTNTQEEDMDATELIREGQSLLQSGNNELAAEVFKKATKADPENGLGWQLLGYALHVDGQLGEAIKAHEKAATFDQFRGIALYNLGCAYSLKEDTEKSLGYLHKSLDEGFDQLDMFSSDADLANVRKSDGWKKIKMRVDNGGKMPETDFEASKLTGNWVVVSGMRSGAKIGSERLPQIKVDKSTITIPGGPNDPYVMGYKLDDSKKPVRIDMEVKSGPAEGGRAVGLIKFEGDHFVLCYDPTGENRPEKFESTEDNGYFLFKAKPAKKQAGTGDAESEPADQKDSDEEDEDEDDGDGVR